MAFGDFTFPQVQADLGLTLEEADLFSSVPSAAIWRRSDRSVLVTEAWSVVNYLRRSGKVAARVRVDRSSLG